MMRFTDIFIKRPVLACVVSLMILLFGLRALTSMELRQFPKMDNTVITITTAYPGASSDLIQGFITTPLEKNIASADGIDYIRTPP
jgi:multidrug efflux pump